MLVIQRATAVPARARAALNYISRTPRALFSSENKGDNGVRDDRGDSVVQKKSSVVEEIERRNEDMGFKMKSYFRKEVDVMTGRGATTLPRETDILIVGGGIVGSSIAYWFKRRCPNSMKITVIERDPTYHSCATTRSAGGVRQQFSLEENCRMAMFGAEFIRDYKRYLGEDAPDPKFNPEGYLFMADTDEKAEQLEKNVTLQRTWGARVELLTQATMKTKFPFMKTEDIKLASYGLQNEGWFDPWALLQGMKQFNLRHQTGYLSGELVDFKFRSLHSSNSNYEPTNHAIIRLPDGDLHELTFGLIIIAAGPQTGHIGNLLRIGTGSGIMSVPIPIEPRKRTIYTFHAPDAPVINFPFMIDPTGTYCRREGMGAHFICGRSPEARDDSPEDTDLDTTDSKYFDEVLWPTLASRVPAFENLKPGRAWAGFYDYNYFDENAIIGRHPHYHHLFICSGFSGHGIQMAPAAGRAIMELIIDGEFVGIDLSRFSFNRVLNWEKVKEEGII